MSKFLIGPATYDTNADTVVRYTAGEVRKRLQLFYHEEGRRSSIRISSSGRLLCSRIFAGTRQA